MVACRCYGKHCLKNSSAIWQMPWPTTVQVDRRGLSYESCSEDEKSLVSSIDGSIFFDSVRSRAEVRDRVSRALSDATDKSAVIEAIRSCGGRWFDCSRIHKNAVLYNFTTSYLNKCPISLEVGNAVLSSFAENKYTSGVQFVLESFKREGIVPSLDTLEAIIRLRIAQKNYDAAFQMYKLSVNSNQLLTIPALLALMSGCVPPKMGFIL